MKPVVLFVISVLGHGRGGHFFSLRSVASALSKSYDVHIATIGVNPSPVFPTGPGCYFIPAAHASLASIDGQLESVVERVRPDIIHAFDSDAFAFCRCIGNRQSARLVLTKAGGPNPTRYYPKAPSLVLFSRENYDYFRRRRKGGADLHLIPNRAMPVVPNEERIRCLRDRIASDHFTFLRVSRFARHYSESIHQAINLLEELRDTGSRVQLILVGAVQDRRVFGSILNRSQVGLHIITDSEFTSNGSEIIPIGDAVIATGRSVMESASFGQVLLTTVGSRRFPVLIQRDNFQELFRSNFSPRNQLENCADERNLLRIRRVIHDSQFRRRYQSESQGWFRDYFDARSVVGKYDEVYRRSSSRKQHRGVDYFLNRLSAYRHFRAASRGAENG